MGDLTSADIPIIILQKDHLCVCSTSGPCGHSDPTAHKKKKSFHRAHRQKIKKRTTNNKSGENSLLFTLESKGQSLTQVFCLNVKHYQKMDIYRDR